MKKILILHGWGSSSKKWFEIKEILEKEGYQVFIPDLPGFGDNPPPSRSWSLTDYTEWLKDFSEKNKLERFFLCGHSFGGGIAVKFSLKYPERVEKLFLLSPALLRKKTFPQKIIEKIASLFKFLPNFLKKIIYKVIKSDYPTTKGVMRETYLKVIREDLTHFLTKLKIPTIIIWGEKDFITPLKQSFLIKEKIENSILEIIKGGGHSFYQEQPEKVSEIILKYLRK